MCTVLINRCVDVHRMTVNSRGRVEAVAVEEGGMPLKTRGRLV